MKTFLRATNGAFAPMPAKDLRHTDDQVAAFLPVLDSDSAKSGLLRPLYPGLLQGWRLFDITLVGIGLYVLSSQWDSFGQRHLFLFILTAILMQLAYSETRVYRIRTRTAARTAVEMLRAWLTVLALLGAIGGLTGTLHMFEPPLLLSWAITAYLLQLASHLFLAAVVRHLRARGHNVRRVLLVGEDAGLIEAFRKHVERLPELGFWLIGYVQSDSPPHPGASYAKTTLASMGKPNDLASLVANSNVDEIYVVTRSLDEASLRRIVVDHLLSLPVDISLVPVDSFLNELNPRPMYLGGQLAYRLSESPMQGFPMAMKRVEDVTLSLVLLVLLSPLLLSIAIAIKTTSPGPVLFMQKRHGRGGREEIIWKFRTMTQASSAADIQCQACLEDERVTRVGRFLRRWSLDELPQLVNVLQGRMSLVGPRPHPVWLDDRFQQQLEAYIRRHRVLPGITGLAQVNGARGETDTLDKMERRLRYDLFYVNNWSLWLDQKILFRTLKTVVKQTNAH